MSDGVVVNLGRLFGVSGSLDPENYYGKKIKRAWFDSPKNRIYLKFFEGPTIYLCDEGQSCCETRYIKCDDDLKTLVGARLKNFAIKDAKSDSAEYGDTHEIQFLEIQTDKGSVAFSTHNEHNGYYGGFLLVIKESRGE